MSFRILCLDKVSFILKRFRTIPVILSRIGKALSKALIKNIPATKSRAIKNKTKFSVKIESKVNLDSQS